MCINNTTGRYTHTVLKWPALELQYSGSQGCRDCLAHCKRQYYSYSQSIAKAQQSTYSCTVTEVVRASWKAEHVRFIVQQWPWTPIERKQERTADSSVAQVTTHGLFGKHTHVCLKQVQRHICKHQPYHNLIFIWYSISNYVAQS